MLNLVNLDLSENNLTFIPPGAFLTLVALRQPNPHCIVVCPNPVGSGIMLMKLEPVLTLYLWYANFNL
jgi:hypothetical protein